MKYQVLTIMIYAELQRVASSQPGQAADAAVAKLVAARERLRRLDLAVQALSARLEALQQVHVKI
jgi:hypothetical protein